MNILSVNKIREADEFTIENEPIKSIDLMERAGINCFNYIKNIIDKSKNVSVFVGPGNNGGDGLVIARLLANFDFIVSVYIIEISKNYSSNFTINIEKAKSVRSLEIKTIKQYSDFPNLNNQDVIIDAIFGSGLNRPADNLVGSIISAINKTNSIVISIDIPSGLFADKTQTSNDMIIKADVCLSLQFPKLSMMMPENDVYVGELHIIPIGLSKTFIDGVVPEAILLESSIITHLIKKRTKFSHKGNYGHALLIAGSKNKTGASILSSKACMRSGVGLLTTHLPSKAVLPLQTSVPEAMLSIDFSEDIFTEIPNLSCFSSIAVGPGIGTDKLTVNALKLLIQEFPKPIIFDADAINIISENKTWLSFIAPNSIFTPHLKEFERLAGKSSNHFERIEKQKELSKKYKVYIILKGAHSTVSCPDGSLFFNNTGNPGMATAGSGDVLSGILLGLLAQGYSSRETALLGVYVHGLAADLALRNQSHESLIASDIISYLGKAFKKLSHV